MISLMNQVSAKHMMSRSFSICTQFTNLLLRFRSIRFCIKTFRIFNSECNSHSFELVAFSYIRTSVHLLLSTLWITRFQILNLSGFDPVLIIPLFV